VATLTTALAPRWTTAFATRAVALGALQQVLQPTVNLARGVTPQLGHPLAEPHDLGVDLLDHQLPQPGTQLAPPLGV
jgi:hypothetical protein